MDSVLKRFSFATSVTMQQLKNSSINENTVKSTAFWLTVWKKWCLEKGIAKEIENYEPTQLNTLLERSYAEIKNKHGQTTQTTIPFHRKWFGHKLNNSLNCLAGLWTFCALKMWNYHCFDRTRLFWSNAQSHLQCLNKLFLHLMRALCFCIIKINYLVLFHVYY